MMIALRVLLAAAVLCAPAAFALAAPQSDEEPVLALAADDDRGPAPAFAAAAFTPAPRLLPPAILAVGLADAPAPRPGFARPPRPRALSPPSR